MNIASRELVEGILRNSHLLGNELGNRIREFRKLQNLTLANIAKNVNCSQSFLSEVENGKSSPSIKTLKEIADALNVNIVDLFTPREKIEEPVIMTPSDRIRISMKRWKATINLLVRNTTNKRMAPFYTVIEPSGGADGSYSHEGEEFGIVLKGELLLTIGDTTYTVKEQESFYYSSQIPHSWINPTKKKTVVLWVVSPPSW